jgi:hypothetical protein
LLRSQGHGKALESIDQKTEFRFGVSKQTSESILIIPMNNIDQFLAAGLRVQGSDNQFVPDFRRLSHRV